MLIPIYDEFGKLNKQLSKILHNKKVALFLDYDGTLTPIVKHPDLAILSQDMRIILQKMSHICPVAIISGRLLQDVRSKVRLKSIFYAGNHGLELRGPDIKKTFGMGYCQTIKHLCKHLDQALQHIPGVLVENKKFTLSVHFRQADPLYIPAIKEAVKAELQKHSELKMRRGKKVIEIYPDIGWDKGRAVNCFLEYFQHSVPDIFPIYLGDDLTDEDAFLAIKHKGLAILVAKSEKDSSADFYLKNPDEVYRFLVELLTIL